MLPVSGDFVIIQIGKRCNQKPAMIDNPVCGSCHNDTIMVDFKWKPKQQLRYERVAVCARCRKREVIRSRGLSAKCYRIASEQGSLHKYPRVRP
jgi:hypothetical protein